jgi:hypothetical protein
VSGKKRAAWPNCQLKESPAGNLDANLNGNLHVNLHVNLHADFNLNVYFIAKISETFGILKHRMPQMSFLDSYYSEKELAELLQSKFGYGGIRMLRMWRQRRMGPPFAKFRKLIVYPKDGTETWLHDQVQKPVQNARSRRVA